MKRSIFSSSFSSCRGFGARWVGRLNRIDLGDERGDVPGWVLVTLMTAGLVVALW